MGENMFTRLVLAWVLCSVAGGASAAITVSSAQLSTEKKSTRLVLESNAPIAHSSQSRSLTLAIDLHEVSPNAVLNGLTRKVNRKDPLLESVQVQRLGRQDTRLLLHLKKPVKPQIQAVGPLKRKRYRLTFDLQPGAEDSPRSVRVPPELSPGRASDKAAALERPAQAGRDNERESKTRINFEREPLADAPEGQENERRPASNFRFEQDERRANGAPETRPGSNFVFEPAPENSVQPRLATSGQLRPRMNFYDDNARASANRPKLKMSTDMGKASRKPARKPRSPKLRVSQSLQGEEEQAANDIALAPANAPFIPNAFLDDTPLTRSEEPGNHAAPGRGEHVWLVALDAGHGGEDPGALGYYGSQEKNITLSIARRVQALLAQTGHVRGVLTRDRDVYVALADRVERAQQASADLFVSIHADAYVNSKVQGSSVFILSRKGASSAAANWLANRENGADLVGAVSSNGNKDPLLMRTLLDLSQAAAVRDSQTLANLMLRELASFNPLHRKRVEQAGFAVLKSPRIPSVLVETAFISNPQEEARLNTATYQNDLAHAIVRGILRFFTLNPGLNRHTLAQRS